MKPKKKKAKPSLLARLFGGKGKAEPAAKKPPARKKAPPEKAAPRQPRSTPLDRSIAEIKTMVRIGQSNPARLATILGNILRAEQEKKAQADEKYRQLIQDILDRQAQQEQDPPPSA
jgi:hypothetical protein